MNGFHTVLHNTSLQEQTKKNMTHKIGCEQNMSPLCPGFGAERTLMVFLLVHIPIYLHYPLDSLSQSDPFTSMDRSFSLCVGCLFLWVVSLPGPFIIHQSVSRALPLWCFGTKPNDQNKVRYLVAFSAILACPGLGYTNVVLVTPLQREPFTPMVGGEYAVFSSSVPQTLQTRADQRERPVK